MEIEDIEARVAKLERAARDAEMGRMEGRAIARVRLNPAEIDADNWSYRSSRAREVVRRADGGERLRVNLSDQNGLFLSP